MENCPFCEKTDTEFFLRSRHFGVIYNIAPILPGHSMVIPIKHQESIFELSEAEIAEFMQLGRKTARLLSEVFHTDSFDLAIQEKEPAGQSVAHLHMHVVPRKIGDLPNPGDWYQELEKQENHNIDNLQRKKLSPQQMVDITRKLKKAAKS